MEFLAHVNLPVVLIVLVVIYIITKVKQTIIKVLILCGMVALIYLTLTGAIVI